MNARTLTLFLTTAQAHLLSECGAVTLVAPDAPATAPDPVLLEQGGLFDGRMLTLESLRRERVRGFDAAPLSRTADLGIPDWATSMVAIEVAVRALGESVANGQRLRTELALALLHDANAALRREMRERGVLAGPPTPEQLRAAGAI
jgi:hypothetical protein